MNKPKMTSLREMEHILFARKIGKTYTQIKGEIDAPI